MSYWLPSELLKTIVLIVQEGVDERGNSTLSPIGSGFLFSQKSISFMLTAKHVVFDNTGREREGVQIVFNSKTLDTVSRPTRFLKETLDAEWVTHPIPNIDLAVIPFCYDRQSDDIRTFPGTLFEDFDRIRVGDDIFFPGFPLPSYLGLDIRRRVDPVIRGGIVGLKRDDGTFLIDANVFPGNSGSPVFFRPSPFGLDYEKGAIVAGGGRQLRFLGIITDYISYTDYAVSPQTGRVRVAFEENSGLGIVCSNRYMTEIFSSPEFGGLLSRLSVGVETTPQTG
jgi:hypothetical protein